MAKQTTFYVLVKGSFLGNYRGSQLQSRKAMIIRKIWQLVVVSILMFYGVAQAELIFSAPPRESPDVGRQTYSAFARYLEHVLGEEVTYEHPGGWMQYASNMRNGKYDIVFDGPHFAAWRMKHINHVAVARLPGKLVFYVIARRHDKRLKSIRSLRAVRFCGLASPNLGTVTIYSYFENSPIYPEIYEVTGGFKGVYEAFKEGLCRAAIIRDNIYKRLDKKEKKDIKIIFTSQPLPNQTLTVTEALFARTKNLSSKLITKASNKAALKIFNRFSKKAKYFQQPDASAYEAIGELLESGVWGWK